MDSSPSKQVEAAIASQTGMVFAFRKWKGILSVKYFSLIVFVSGLIRCFGYNTTYRMSFLLNAHQSFQVDIAMFTGNDDYFDFGNS